MRYAGQNGVGEHVWAVTGNQQIHNHVYTGLNLIQARTAAAGGRGGRGGHGRGGEGRGHGDDGLGRGCGRGRGYGGRGRGGEPAPGGKKGHAKEDKADKRRRDGYRIGKG